MAMDPAAKKILRIALLVVIAALTLAAVLVWRGYNAARGHLSESRCDGHTTFVRSEWMDTTLATGLLAVRGCMIDDFLERHELRGKTRAEVVALIGEPQPSDLFPDYDMVYWLGPERGLIGTDAEFLVMKLDKAGRVTLVELRTG